jgi:membrane associated rhomboid family serine protease
MSEETSKQDKQFESQQILKALSFRHAQEMKEHQQQHGQVESTLVLNHQQHSQQQQQAKQRQELLRQFRTDPNSSHYTNMSEFYDCEAQEMPYIVRQKKGYLSLGFSILQSIILFIMMVQCSIAPFDINPMLGPPPDALDYWGGKNALKIITDGEYWRLITPIFLHAGILHLVCNVAVQLDVGAFFEREWGSPIWFIIYVLSALGSSIFSCCFKPNNISVGSSGAVMGLFGGKLAEIFCRQRESKKTVQGRIGHEVRQEQLRATLCSVTVVMAFSFVPYVDWAAHFGGFLAGFTAGFLCFAPRIKTKSYAIFWFVVGVVMNAFLYGGLISYMMNDVQPNNDLQDVCGYYKQYFDDYECQCQLN